MRSRNTEKNQTENKSFQNKVEGTRDTRVTTHNRSCFKRNNKKKLLQNRNKIGKMKRITEKATDIEDRQRTTNMCTTGVPIKKTNKEDTTKSN